MRDLPVNVATGWDLSDGEPRNRKKSRLLPWSRWSTLVLQEGYSGYDDRWRDPVDVQTSADADPGSTASHHSLNWHHQSQSMPPILWGDFQCWNRHCPDANWFPGRFWRVWQKSGPVWGGMDPRSIQKRHGSFFPETEVPWKSCFDHIMGSTEGSARFQTDCYPHRCWHSWTFLLPAIDSFPSAWFQLLKHQRNGVWR